MNFEIGEKYTLFSIGKSLPMAFRMEVKCKQILPDGRPAFSEPKKRKLFTVKFDNTLIIVPGWDIKPVLDGEYTNNGNRSFAINGKFVFVTENKQEVIKILDNNMNPNFNRFDCVQFGPWGNPKNITITPRMMQIMSETNRKRELK